MGSLGWVTFVSGYYLYVGSAMNGLKSRVGRHLSGGSKVHWHIDYLSPYFEKVGAIMVETNENLECVFSSKIKELPFYLFEVERFGSSDCRCVSHLFGVSFEPSKSDMEFMAVICDGIDKLVSDKNLVVICEQKDYDIFGKEEE